MDQLRRLHLQKRPFTELLGMEYSQSPKENPVKSSGMSPFAQLMALVFRLGSLGLSL